MSKRRGDSALYVPYTGPYRGDGPHRNDGDTRDSRRLPDQYLQATQLEGNIQTCMSQAQLLHKELSQPLNVVIIVKTNRQTGAWAHVILCSSALALPDDHLVDYDGLRFQIACNFRDAKQSWGLEDFMHTAPTAVTHAANLSLCLVNLSYRLLHDFRQVDPDYSILD